MRTASENKQKAKYYAMPEELETPDQVDRALLCMDACKKIHNKDLAFLPGAFVENCKEAEKKFWAKPGAQKIIDDMRNKKRRKSRKLPSRLNTPQKRYRAILCMDACRGIANEKLLPGLFAPILRDTQFMVMNKWMGG